MQTFAISRSSLALAAVASAVLVSGCTPRDDAMSTTVNTAAETKGASPDAKPTPEPEPKATADVDITISSLQLNENCPDPAPDPQAKKPAKKAVEAKSQAMPADEEEHAGDSPDAEKLAWAPCVQSTLQLALKSKTARAVPMSITEIRLYRDGHAPVLSKIESRGPQQWSDGTYVAWDEVLPKNAELKASYKLADPDWAAVTKATGEPAWGPTYVVEVDVLLDGKTKRTVRSTPVPREMPEEIQT